MPDMAKTHLSPVAARLRNAHPDDLVPITLVSERHVSVAEFEGAYLLATHECVYDMGYVRVMLPNGEIGYMETIDLEMDE